MSTDNSRQLPDFKTYALSSTFPYKFRPPMWGADAIIPPLPVPPPPVPPTTDPQRDEVIFKEEALGTRLNHYVPFRVPANSAGTAFAEPENGTAEDWHQFNQWILGGKLVPPPDTDYVEFHHFIEALCGQCRNYNASLYKMRRLHFCFNQPNRATAAMPPANPTDGLPADIHHLTDAEIAGWLQSAFSDYERDTRNLNTLLQNGYIDHNDVRQDVIADMVQVNGYIISIRVIGEITKRPSEEYGGGSSSHISLSSAFSSSSGS